MALEVIVSPFLEVLFDKLSSLISGEFGQLQGVGKDLGKLSDTLSTIKTVLADAEAKQINDQRSRGWLKKLEDAAYDAEDVLEEFAFESLNQESEIGDTSCTEQVSASFSNCLDFKRMVFRRKMGKRIRELIEKFNEIDAERFKFQLSPGVVSRVEEFCHDRETISVLTEPLVYGRAKETEDIIKILLENASSSNNISICPIVGIGGLGKTTLAQLVYGDERVVNHFDTRVWVCVSEDFGVKRITKMVIDQLSEKKCDLEDLEPMQKLLKKLLNGMKFLLVLDDVWYDGQEKWNKIIHLLACGVRGSSIIVTTRLQTVVNSLMSLQSTRNFFAGTINPQCDLKFLSDHDCWSLFEHYAHGVGENENQDLIEVGKEVVKKCKGVPLAIKAVGSLLKFKREEVWRLVRDSEIWHLEEHGEYNILPALRLSYNHLPPRYRQCFAYCSVYPKDWLFKKENLIHGWMANGYIRASRGLEVEDIGNDIFDGLLQQSFFLQDILKSTSYGEIQYYKMHDLVHDLACSITNNECSRVEDVLQRARHVSMTYNSPYSLLKSPPSLRTLFFMAEGSTGFSGQELFLSRFSNSKYLRVLDLRDAWTLSSVPPWIGNLKHLRYLNLENTGIAKLPMFICGLTNLQILLLSRNERLTALPSSVGNLKSLRFLDVSGTGIKILPESICSLTNLQTLRVESLKLEKLPKQTKNMRTLRNLSGVSRINSIPNGIRQLTRLETLSLFTVRSSSEGGAGIQELGRLNQLKGSLHIVNIRHVQDPREAQEANMKNKHRLSHLSLMWSLGGVPSLEEDEEKKKRSKQVIESLQPHPNLQELKIWHYPGEEVPDWVRNCAMTLPKLRKLYFVEMPNIVVHLLNLPPFLQTLYIVTCPKLRLPPTTMLPLSIKILSVAESNDPILSSVEALPHLSDLQIEGFHEHVTLPEAHLRNLTCFRSLAIINCSKLKRLPIELENIATTLKNLFVHDCDELSCIRTEGLRNLTSLTQLKFQTCGSLKSLSDSSPSLRYLTVLKDLFVDGCPKLEMSTFDLQHLVALKHLRLSGLPQLTALPDGIQHVTTLQFLVIQRCENLKKLPEWLQQHLPPSLWNLEIRKCHPELHKRCEMDKGEEWNKISHLLVVNVK